MKKLISFLCLFLSLNLLANQEIFELLDDANLDIYEGSELISDYSRREIEKMIKDGIDPNLTNEQGESLLYIASGKNLLGIVELLIQKGADVNFKVEDSGYTALYVASLLNNFTVLKSLLEHKANPNIANKWGETALHNACKKGSYSEVQLLVQYGADVNLKTYADQRAVIHYLTGSQREHPQILEFLYSHGADLKALNYKGENLFDNLENNKENRYSYQMENFLKTNKIRKPIIRIHFKAHLSNLREIFRVRK